jgi:hypothetical protein
MSASDILGSRNQEPASISVAKHCRNVNIHSRNNEVLPRRSRRDAYLRSDARFVLEVRMSLTDLASIGSFVSGVAVLISLVYLAMQVRDSLRAQRAAMHQARLERVTTVSVEFAKPEIAGVLAKASTPSPDFSATEVVQLFNYMRIQVAALDDAIWQHDAGFLDKASLQTTILTMKRVMANPALRAVWNLVHVQLEPGLRKRILDLLEETPMTQPTDWAAAWKEEYAKLVASAT